MLKKVYKLNFKKSSYDLNEDYERLSDHEKERISELDADTYFDYDDDDECYICYVITTQQEIDRYLKILTNNLCIYNNFYLTCQAFLNFINFKKVGCNIIGHFFCNLFCM